MITDPTAKIVARAYTVWLLYYGCFTAIVGQI